MGHTTVEWIGISNRYTPFRALFCCLEPWREWTEEERDAEAADDYKGEVVGRRRYLESTIWCGPES